MIRNHSHSGKASKRTQASAAISRIGNGGDCRSDAATRGGNGNSAILAGRIAETGTGRSRREGVASRGRTVGAAIRSRSVSRGNWANPFLNKGSFPPVGGSGTNHHFGVGALRWDSSIRVVFRDCF
jgi:hypothetical protein